MRFFYSSLLYSLPPSYTLFLPLIISSHSLVSSIPLSCLLFLPHPTKHGLVPSTQYDCYYAWVRSSERKRNRDRDSQSARWFELCLALFTPLYIVFHAIYHSTSFPVMILNHSVHSHGTKGFWRTFWRACLQPPGVCRVRFAIPSYVRHANATPFLLHLNTSLSLIPLISPSISLPNSRSYFYHDMNIWCRSSR